MQEEENSYYSNDEEYFLDVCRAGEVQQLQEFISNMPVQSTFDWTCTTNANDNFLHMLAANNLTELFDYIFPIVAKRLEASKLDEMIVNKQNSTGNTPIHYAVITNSKEMVLKLLQLKPSLTLLNDSNRTAFGEAEEFDKFDIAQILAPLVKGSFSLQKEMQLLDVCNEDSDEQDEGQHEKLQEIQEQARQEKDQ